MPSEPASPASSYAQQRGQPAGAGPPTRAPALQADVYQDLVGPLPPVGELPPDTPHPFASRLPDHEGIVDRDGVRLWWARYGMQGPWLFLVPPFQIVHSSIFKGLAPWLADHFRVVVMDPRGNGRSDRPDDPSAYTLAHLLDDTLAVMDAAGFDRGVLVGLSLGAQSAIRIAADWPARVSHLVVIAGRTVVSVPPRLQAGDAAGAAGNVAGDTAGKPGRAATGEGADPGGRADTGEAGPSPAALALANRMVADWPAFVDGFFRSLYTEPHSTKPIEDGVHYAWATRPAVIASVLAAQFGIDVRADARRVTCPMLIIHGDDDHRIPYALGVELKALIPDARLLTVAGGGHCPLVRDPVLVNRAIRRFVLGLPHEATWTRAMARPRRALFVSSAIGLGHVQRDLAIARALRALQPDLEIVWFTVEPALSYLVREGETVHPATARLANESRHFESVAGEHDLQAFFALRTMDEVMTRNFMVLHDVLAAEPFDLVIGDEAWDLDYYLHENPELKRQPFVFLTDFVGCLPMSNDRREQFLCADRNADEIERIGRYPYIRDASIFIGNPDDVTELPFGPGLPSIRRWTDENFRYSGYALPFDPAAFADAGAQRERLGYDPKEKLVVAAVGGTAVGTALLDRIAAAFPVMKRQLPELRMLLVTGPRIAADRYASSPGLEVRPYVHNLFEHLACADLALVQGGLSTCMELVAARRPFLCFPLQRHFEQCIHVQHRLRNYCAECALDFRTETSASIAEKALDAIDRPVRYRPVEADGAARAARMIAEVLENRHWRTL